MNRLVIIGNGFDLAHGLPTSYKDFIDDFWVNFKHNCKSELYEQIVTTHSAYDVFYKSYGEIKNFRDFKSNLLEYCNDYNCKFYEEDCVAIHKTNDVFKVKNKFFLKINNKGSIENWVDIENLYYSELKSIIKNNCQDTNNNDIQYEKNSIRREEICKKLRKEQVEKLNLEFEQVKKLFEIYLNKIIKKYNLDFTTNLDIYNKLKPISLHNEDNVFEEFIKEEDKKEIKKLFEIEKKEILVNNLYFLNFNYTPIAKTYNDLLNRDERIDSKINFIHGELNNTDENKINFGFGDEMDEDYKTIENINDNEYLRNFKSFQYLQNSNYSNLLNFIDSDKFQVVVIGHSCGLSDRTLLNTIFEHKNCRSIKVYYYQWKDKETNEFKDNYTEIIQNISRHFNKKKVMREKIVNKTLCQPFPQIQLSKK